MNITLIGWSIRHYRHLNIRWRYGPSRGKTAFSMLLPVDTGISQPPTPSLQTCITMNTGHSRHNSAKHAGESQVDCDRQESGCLRHRPWPRQALSNRVIPSPVFICITVPSQHQFVRLRCQDSSETPVACETGCSRKGGRQANRNNCLAKSSEMNCAATYLDRKIRGSIGWCS